jgi:hypothetical protein
MNPADTLREFLLARSNPPRARALLRTGATNLPHYRDSGIVGHAQALQAAFPTVLMLLGEAGFHALSTDFARATADHHWDLNAYGSELPAWIRAEQPDADGALLVDAAQVDWAMHRAAFALDCPPLDRSTLAAVDAARQALLRFTPHPATALVASTQPMASLWRSARDEAFVMPASRAETALIGRDLQNRVWMRPLAAGETAFTAALLAGASLAQGLDAALQADPAFDLATCLQLQLADQVWSGCY